MKKFSTKVVIGALVAGTGIFLLFYVIFIRVPSAFEANYDLISSPLLFLGIGLLIIFIPQRKPKIYKSPFPSLGGVQIQGIHETDVGHSYVGGINSTGSVIHNSYKTRGWNIFIKNESAEDAQYELLFWLQQNGVTVSKQTLHGTIEPGETVRQDLKPSGENDTVLLKRMLVKNRRESDSKDLNHVLGKTGFQTSPKTILVMIAICIVVILLVRSCLKAI